uniref:CYTOSOL_AP domain-containing protein n=1 Tax=Rhabditophanes sp. KR3021 TaxID=114890 RepID=A0AC35U4C2_9BILA
MDLIHTTFYTFENKSAASNNEDSFFIILTDALTFKSLTYETNIKPHFGNSISAAEWSKHVDGNSDVSIHLIGANTGAVVILTDRESLSRHNSPIQPKSVTDNILKCISFTTKTKFDLFYIGPKENIVGTITAAVKCFNIYSEKTSKTPAKTMNFEMYHLVDGHNKAICDRFKSQLEVLSKGISMSRVITEMPPNIMGPDYLEAFTREALKEFGEKIVITSLAGLDLEKEGFGGIYNVGKGANQAPRLIHVEYDGSDNENLKTIAIVGKGITFDTGGYTIKGRTGMPGMKRDCGGAAAALGSFYCLVKGEVKAKLHLLLCIAENAVGPNALKPDDVIKMYSGKSVEVNNTDAEGRLVLGDGVAYAKQILKCNVIVDVATLTGAQAYHSGKFHGSVFTNSANMEDIFVKCGREISGEMVHPLLFCPELYMPDLESLVADMKNANLGNMSAPPSSLAAHFIGAQIDHGKDVEWVHLDIAAPAKYLEYSTGFGASLIATTIKHYVNSVSNQ